MFTSFSSKLMNLAQPRGAECKKNMIFCALLFFSKSKRLIGTVGARHCIISILYPKNPGSRPRLQLVVDNVILIIIRAKEDVKTNPILKFVEI